MLTVTPYHPGDADQALRLFRWISELGGAKGHSLLLIADTRCSSEVTAEIERAAGESFDSVTVLPFVDHFKQWPHSPNACFSMAARHIMANQKSPWLMLEPDCVPLKAGWLDAIEAEYKAAGKPFMGARVEVEGVPLHCSGNAVYPADMYLAGNALIANDVAWDMVAAEQIVPQAHFTKLIEHSWKRDPVTKANLAVSFDSWEQVEREVSKEAVVYHACKNSSLVDRLREHNNLPVPVLADVKEPVSEEVPGITTARDSMNAPESKIGSESRGGQFTCDLFLKTYPGDAAWLPYCLRSIAKFAAGFQRLVIVYPDGTPRPDFDGTWGYSMAIVTHGVPESGDGYMIQQVRKLTAHEYSDASHILFLDSDTIFARPVTPETYFVGDKITWLMTPWQKTETPWRPSVEKFLGESVEFEFMRRHPFMVPRSLLIAIGEFCQQKHGMSIEQYVMSQPNRDFSEFNCLGAFAYRCHHDAFHWINTEEASELPPLTVRQHFSWGGLSDEIRAEMETILSGAGEPVADAAHVDPPAQSFQKGGDASCPNASADCQTDQPEAHSSHGNVLSIATSNAAPTFEPERAADAPWTHPALAIEQIQELATELQRFCVGGAKTRRVREELHKLGVVELPYRNKKRKGWKRKRKAKA